MLTMGENYHFQSVSTWGVSTGSPTLRWNWKTRNKVLDLNILDAITNELTLTTESQINISCRPPVDDKRGYVEVEALCDIL